MPTEPAATRWSLPPADRADPDGIAGVGADLEPGTLLEAYRSGLFPMPLGPDGPIGWWSPDPRGIIEVADLHVSRSLRRTARRYEIRIDTAFEATIDRCRGLPRRGGWITPDMRDAYVGLHHLGWAHSIEAWNAGGELVGGLYGVAIGGLFAGESMFHTQTDASKAALVALVELLDDGVERLFDVQWRTPHLASLGATELPRSEYLRRVGLAIDQPVPSALQYPPVTEPEARHEGTPRT